MFTVELENKSSLWHTQKQATFMFNSNGINFVDMAYLRMSNIIGDFKRLHYERAKTGQKFDIIIAGKSKEILEYYTRGKIKHSDQLIFPILPQHIIGEGKQEVSLYKSRRKVFNQNLKKIAAICGIERNVTTYVLRHSFATGLKRSGVNESFISEALGHDSVETTRIYLDSFDSKENDEVTNSIAI